MQNKASTRRIFAANARNQTNTPGVSHMMNHFRDFCDRKATVAINREHQPVSVCDCRIAEHNYKVREQLKSRAHKECMAKMGRYVGRALDRLTVTTMLLCRDSALKVLARKARFGGSSFFVLRRADMRPSRFPRGRTWIFDALWIAVDDTPWLWITSVLRPQGRFSLRWYASRLFNRRYE